jgi:hypothetical protein
MMDQSCVVLVESANEVVIGHLADEQSLWIPWNRNTLSTVRHVRNGEFKEWVAFMVLPWQRQWDRLRWGVCFCRRNQSGSSDQWIPVSTMAQSSTSREGLSKVGTTE